MTLMNLTIVNEFPSVGAPRYDRFHQRPDVTAGQYRFNNVHNAKVVVGFHEIRHLMHPF